MNDCQAETTDMVMGWPHFCTHPTGPHTTHECLCGYTWNEQ